MEIRTAWQIYEEISSLVALIETLPENSLPDEQWFGRVYLAFIFCSLSAIILILSNLCADGALISPQNLKSQGLTRKVLKTNDLLTDAPARGRRQGRTFVPIISLEVSVHGS